MKHWYVIQVLSSKEKQVKQALDENKETSPHGANIEEILLPTEKVMEVKQGQQKISERRIWPGYLLVKMELTDEVWMLIRRTNGVIAFLGGEKPTPLSEKEVQTILNDLEEKKKGVTQKHQFEIGSHVKITDGVFVNFMGTVTGVQHEKGKLSVSVSIFGRETQVDDLEFWQVEEVSEDAEAEN
ncbi:MAG: Transcription termination/antitermination protein NusG [Chlamydiae bacterium]|nr:Transcription termination/antitermination protein NusG [Chlamydiota bacterium]